MSDQADLKALRAITESDVRDMLFGKVYVRAVSYYHGGRVCDPQRIGAMLRAHVQGTELYTVKVQVEGGQLLASCTCPFAETAVCKHIGAVLLQWIHEPESFIVDEDEQAAGSTDGETAPAGRSRMAAQAYAPSLLRERTAAYGALSATPSAALGGRFAAPAIDAESEERESVLSGLLSQLPLSDLRDIARQRGWRIKATTKADYAAALASLLGDPTEIARAVTSIPNDLREALRAVFVTDDGSGITPTALAQTMTALRGTAGPTIKPVEAAALLTDLAGWGLVLVWRDSLSDHARYLFPWEIQRFVPPLPGWCQQPAPPDRWRAAVAASPSGTDAEVAVPAATPREAESRDAVAAIRSLYSVWERIAQEQPAVRAPLQPTAERRFLSMLQGWPHDPEELQSLLAGNRRRAELAAQALSAPPTPFLLEDDALAKLAGAIGAQYQHRQTDGGTAYQELDFLCRILYELGLATIKRGHLIAQQAAMASFLRRSVTEQHKAMARSYLSLLDWSELDLLLRSNPRLVLWHKPQGQAFFSYDQFRPWLVRLRHVVLRFLACAGEEGWCELSDVDSSLRTLWPHFAEILQGERPPWASRAWGLAQRREGRELDTRSPIDWDAGQGALLRVMLEGPLYWLGFAELSHKDGQLVACRLRGLTDWMWDRPMALAPGGEKPSGEALTIDEGACSIAVHPRAVPAQAHTLLARIAVLQQAAPGRFVYSLDMRATYATFESGVSLPDILTEWEEVFQAPIPGFVEQALRKWWQSYGRVRIYDGFALLELQDNVTLQELEASTSLSQHIVGRLSPRLVLVPDEAADSLLAEFTARGYTPKQLE